MQQNGENVILCRVFDQREVFFFFFKFKMDRSTMLYTFCVFLVSVCLVDFWENFFPLLIPGRKTHTNTSCSATNIASRALSVDASAEECKGTAF